MRTFPGLYGKKEGTLAQKRAAKLSGARRQFPSGLYVCSGRMPYTCGNVTGHRLVGSGVQIKIGSHWYPKSDVTKSPRVIRAIRRRK